MYSCHSVFVSKNQPYKRIHTITDPSPARYLSLAIMEAQDGDELVVPRPFLKPIAESMASAIGLSITISVPGDDAFSCYLDSGA